ncbi:hypothetical protein HPP92_021077 [Vanilla planifolia]|uniref:FAD-binding FR-type domain-containing protein n=1 Tax=Vanilla planifolia TaxID=51239 RepID=A0A835Q1V2_VANPL|nr:hypothetical protein HPP92_021077 [Vanilla planifolia]
MESKRSLVMVLRLSMVAMLAVWTCIWILKPTRLWKRSWHVAEGRAGSTFIGESGLNVVVFCFPFLVAAVISFSYVSISSSDCRLREKKAHLATGFSLPVISTSPFGVLLLGELLAMLCFVIFLLWTYYSNVSSDFKRITPSKTLHLNGMQLKMMSLGVRFGSLSEACLAVLLLPILRGMALFRVVGIQFEASVRYHIWIANGMMLFSLLHGTIIMSVWGSKSILLEEITKWQRTGRIYLAGAITLVIGLTIWITALPAIRRKYFQLFYSIHNLYIVFILFFLLHAGERHFYLVFSGVMLFALDKVLRLLHSRRVVSLLSARIFPCRAIELTFRKNPSLKYTPTSILFVKIPSISKFQWHPFSIISSSKMEDEKLSILVKCHGRWTNSLYDSIESMSNKASDHLGRLSVSVEGPYGPINLSYERYDRLVLVAGGSGITPFLGILQDMASRNHSRKNHTAKVHLLYVVRKLQDLNMLTPVSTLLLHHSPNESQITQLKLSIFVTQEQGSSSSSVREILGSMSQTKAFIVEQSSSKDVLPGPEGPMWRAGITGLASIVFLICILCLNRFCIHEGKKPSKDKSPSWVYDLFVICSFAIAITSCIMATVVSQWRGSADGKCTSLGKNSCATLEAKAQRMELDYEINFGRRPNLIDVLSEEPVEAGETKVGVFVCGPYSMQESVALFCRSYSMGAMLRRDGKKKKCSFLFHSINFSL